MHKICLVCKGDRSDVLYPGILKCVSCGFVFADLDLPDESFFRLYQHEYFHDGEYGNYRADEQVLRKNFQLRLKVLKRFLRPDRHKRLLEIGCAYGFFLDTARSLFETAEGIDVTAEGVRSVRETYGLSAVEGDFLMMDLSKRMWDVVCLWDTIEHLPKPDRYIEKISRHAGPGSLLAITTGDIESCNARIRKQHWRLIHPPTHAYYFSLKTLGRLLDRHGFDVIYSRHCGFYRSIDQAAYSILVRSGRAPGLYDILNRIGVIKASFYLNLYDIIYLIARKR